MGKNQVLQFPDPESASDDGLLCFGGDLEISTLLSAYRMGIFPWPQEGLPLLWFSPLERGVLNFDCLHWSRRFLRAMKDDRFLITFNQDFARVIKECAMVPRSHETGTWILPEMQKSYIQLHEAGYAHSVECWLAGQLVGGLYGVYVDGVFSGESMFYKASDASKRCLFALIEVLRENHLKWMDIQMVTPVLEKLGGSYVSRAEYLRRVIHSQASLPERLLLKGNFQWSSK